MSWKNCVWAEATRVTIPIVGVAIFASSAIWPGPLAPISRIRCLVELSAERMVSGKPSSLLNESLLTWTSVKFLRDANKISFVVVFPTEPVIPITSPVILFRSNFAKS